MAVDPPPADGAQAELEGRMREAFEVWNREGLEAFAQEYWHPDILWEEPPGFPDAGVHHGRESCVRRMGERLSLLGHVGIEVIDVTAVSEDTALAEVVVRGQGTSSGAPGEMREWFLVELRNGRTIHFREFLDRSAALAASEAQSRATQ